MAAPKPGFLPMCEISVSERFNIVIHKARLGFSLVGYSKVIRRCWDLLFQAYLSTLSFLQSTQKYVANIFK